MENEAKNKDRQNACPIIHGLRLISKKWVLEVFCELNRSAFLRYSEIKRRLYGITNMALTQVLKELAERGLVHREQYNEVPPHTEYSLTDEGKALLPSLYSLAKWGYKQMGEGSTACGNDKGCYALHYEYVPYNKEIEVLRYPEQYNERYYNALAKIVARADGDIILRIQSFLEEMLKILTIDGPEATRWAMTYYFRPDTPHILEQDRPQYKILCDMLSEGQRKGIITKDMGAAYLADELSKIVTGMVGEWLMDKHSYDIVEYNLPMLRCVCRGLHA